MGAQVLQGLMIKYVSVQLSSADPAFFSIFTFPFVYGNRNEALKNLQDIVIAKSKAKELFGTDNVLGQNYRNKNC